MRDDLRNNPDQFLVNLILMSVQFLKSHDRQFVVDQDVDVGVDEDVDADVDEYVDVHVDGDVDVNVDGDVDVNVDVLTSSQVSSFMCNDTTLMV